MGVNVTPADCELSPRVYMIYFLAKWVNATFPVDSKTPMSSMNTHSTVISCKAAEIETQTAGHDGSNVRSNIMTQKPWSR